jgi:RNA polymerase sigma-70 factor (ECF subfamily)
MSVASVTSALQRARAQLAAASPSADGAGLGQPSDSESQDLLDRYIAAFTMMDVEALKATLREDALLQMPPFPEWFLGRDAIVEFLAVRFARGGSYRCVQTRANGQPTMGLYRRRDSDAYRFLHLQILTTTATGIARIDGFHASELYLPFGLPAVLAD